jgi:hypothetical protein
LDRPSQLGQVLIGQFQFRMVRGELEKAEGHAEEIRELGETRNDVIWRLAGSRISGTISCFLGKFIEARAYGEHALSTSDSKLRVSSGAASEDPHVANLLYLSRTLLCLGQVDKARLRRDEALAEARGLSPYNLAYARCLAWYCDYVSEGAEVAQTILPSADEVIAISSEKGFALWLAVGNIMRGWCLSAIGQPAEGIPLILRGIAASALWVPK